MQQLTDDWHIEYQASNRADGLILLGYGDYMTYREKLDALDRANTRFIIWGPTINEQPGHSIGCDNVDGGFQAASHLLDAGRRKIAFLGNTTRRCPELAARYQGYRTALTHNGIEADASLKIDANSLTGLGYRGIEELLHNGREFDAVFAVTDAIAIDAIRALQENGYDVPGDVAVVGFDDIPLAAHVTPSLTTVRQDIRQASEGLVRSIVGLIEGEPVESTLMAPALVIRESCGARG